MGRNFAQSNGNLHDEDWDCLRDGTMIVLELGPFSSGGFVKWG